MAGTEQRVRTVRTPAMVLVVRFGTGWHRLTTGWHCWWGPRVWAPRISHTRSSRVHGGFAPARRARDGRHPGGESQRLDQPAVVRVSIRWFHTASCAEGFGFPGVLGQSGSRGSARAASAWNRTLLPCRGLRFPRKSGAASSGTSPALFSVPFPRLEVDTRRSLISRSQRLLKTSRPGSACRSATSWLAKTTRITRSLFLT